MRLAAFSRALVEDGRLRIDSPDPSQVLDWTETDVILAEWNQANRLEFPGDAPPFDSIVARWAFESLYRACQFTIYRDADAKTIASALTTACPDAPTAAQHYTVELAFRFLPELYRLVRSKAEGDPLVETLRDWAERWPLSSVGMPGVNPTDVSAVSDHVGLLQLYVDRIVARRDVSRVEDPRVRAAVRSALGYFDELAPQLAAAIRAADDKHLNEPVI